MSWFKVLVAVLVFFAITNALGAMLVDARDEPELAGKLFWRAIGWLLALAALYIIGGRYGDV